MRWIQGNSGGSIVSYAAALSGEERCVTTLRTTARETRGSIESPKLKHVANFENV